MKKNLSGLKISLNQMPVIPGRPDLNAKYVIESIKEAAKEDVDILAFPELGVTGYLIGDLFEDECFGKEVNLFNEKIAEAVPSGMTVIFGTLVSCMLEKNEDGRFRKYNAAIVVSGGTQSLTIKTLQPNYRFFDDDRYFFSGRKESYERHLGVDDYLTPFVIKTRIGSINLGVILCEDMWHQDYPVNPTKILVDNGAEIVFNLSASPWTWQKNRKRHQVVRDLLKVSPVPFVYVNNTGTQNNGKNIIVFDGSSTVYNEKGEIIMSVPPYATGNHNFIFSEAALNDIQVPIEKTDLSLEERIKNDAGELYDGWERAVRGAFNNLPISMRKAVIGLSGGIDSAVDAVLLSHILGPENVYCINMPSNYNSQQTKNIAEQIALNLGVNYEIRPINGIVDAICKATGTKVDSLSYENVQARVRMEILAARCQDLVAVFICNSNKIETAFGYGTMYGDIAGFIAPLGDMLKYEVYQMGDYLNRVIYQREVIPTECFTIAPSAELKNKQKDPFHYGSLKTRGYHDELVRAFIEFRYNPEVILEKYISKNLEQEFRLEPGTLDQLFKTPADFIVDLEKNYNLMINSFFKRHQAPSIPILSRRAFGFDLRESQLSPFLTSRYSDLKQLVLPLKPKFKIAIYGGSFNPPCMHHQKIADKLVKEFDQVIIVPCGSARSDKSLVNNEYRVTMAGMAYCGRAANMEIDFYDMGKDVYTPTYLVQERYLHIYPEAEIWHVVGSDLIAGGSENKSQIQRTWKRGIELWQNLKFCVIARPGYPLIADDLPPNAKVLEIEENVGSGTMIREMLAQHKDVSQFVDSKVLSYIQAHKVYGS